MELKSTREVELFDEDIPGFSVGNIYRWFMNYFVLGLDTPPQVVHPILHGMAFEIEPEYAKKVVNSFLNSYNLRHLQTPWSSLFYSDPIYGFVSNDQKTCEEFCGLNENVLNHDPTDCLIYGNTSQSWYKDAFTSKRSFTFDRVINGESHLYFIGENRSGHIRYAYFRSKTRYGTFNPRDLEEADEIPLETFYAEIKELIFRC